MDTEMVSVAERAAGAPAPTCMGMYVCRCVYICVYIYIYIYVCMYI